VGPRTSLHDSRREKNNQIDLKVITPAHNLATRYEVRWGEWSYSAMRFNLVRRWKRVSRLRPVHLNQKKIPPIATKECLGRF
jgi:hypothetical protein